MHVVVDLPDPKPNGLDAALTKQFADIQRQLMGMVKEKETSSQSMQQLMLDALEAQQTTLVKALERLMGMVSQSVRTTQPSDALVGAVQGLKQVMADLPSDLKSALDHQYQSTQDRMMKVSVRPQVTVELPKGLLGRLDTLETSVLNGLHRSRNRTFGSNF